MKKNDPRNYDPDNPAQSRAMDPFPDEIMEEELSGLLSSLPDDVMLELLTEFGLAREGDGNAG